MKLSFEVSLSDLATAIEYQDGSDSERQEVMDFLVTADECMADYVFSQELIYRLSVSRERALSEAKAKVDQVMEDFSSWKKSKPLPLSTECVCGCPEAAHE